MSGSVGGRGDWRHRIWAAAFVTLAVGVIARLTAWLLGPVIPLLLIIVLLGGIYWLIVERFRRW